MLSSQILRVGLLATLRSVLQSIVPMQSLIRRTPKDTSHLYLHARGLRRVRACAINSQLVIRRSPCDGSLACIGSGMLCRRLEKEHYCIARINPPESAACDVREDPSRRDQRLLQQITSQMRARTCISHWLILTAKNEYKRSVNGCHPRVGRLPKLSIKPCLMDPLSSSKASNQGWGLSLSSWNVMQSYCPHNSGNALQHYGHAVKLKDVARHNCLCT